MAKDTLKQSGVNITVYPGIGFGTFTETISNAYSTIYTIEVRYILILCVKISYYKLY